MKKSCWLTTGFASQRANRTPRGERIYMAVEHRNQGEKESKRKWSFSLWSRELPVKMPMKLRAHAEQPPKNKESAPWRKFSFKYPPAQNSLSQIRVSYSLLLLSHPPLCRGQMLWLTRWRRRGTDTVRGKEERAFFSPAVITEPTSKHKLGRKNASILSEVKKLNIIVDWKY